MLLSFRDSSQASAGSAGRTACRLAVAAAAMVSALAFFSGQALPSEAPSRPIDDVRRIIEAHGFSHIQSLELDAGGVWRGQAAKYDRSWDVEVDQRGNFSGAPISAPASAPVGAPVAAPVGEQGEGDTPPAVRPKPTIRLFLVIK